MVCHNQAELDTLVGVLPRVLHSREYANSFDSLERGDTVEALMDMVLLSRANLVAGKMMSNFPRVALQVQLPLNIGRGAAPLQSVVAALPCS